MKLRLVLLGLLLAATAGAAAQWTKYVAADKSYSIHVPTGWVVTPTDAVLAADNPKTGEQLVLIAATADAGAGAKDMALKLLTNLQKALPTLQVTQWNDLADTGEYVFADLAYTEQGQAYQGNLFLLLGGGSAIWFDYTALATDYSRLRAKALLDGFIRSFVGDANSQAPDVDIPDLARARLDRNASAFLFVLEFGCGTAFTATREQALRDEIVEAWRALPEAQRAAYDKYPDLVKTILALKQDQLAALQGELKRTVTELLDQSADSPGIKLLRDQMHASSQVLAAGDPPLTAAAADGYAELMGFVQAMAKKPHAGPEDIDATVVKHARADLLKAWPSFQDNDKQAVLSAPALWLALRTTFRQGTAEDKQQARAGLKQLVAATTETKPASNTTTTSEVARRALQHQTLLMMQQQTFNTYMWSRGFAGWTPAGKMW